MNLEFHQFFMRLALAEAEKGVRAGEIPVGCIIIEQPLQPSTPPENVVILAQTFNQSEMRNDATAHAEMLALNQAAAVRGEWRLTNTVLYATKEPCPMCTGAIVLARIPLVIWGTNDPRRGGHTVFSIFTHPGINHHPQIINGVLAQETRTQLQDFFQQRRQSSD